MALYIKKKKNPDTNSIIDNKNGLGAVPDNLDVDYLGLKVFIYPLKFLLDLVKTSKSGLDRQNIEYMKNYIRASGKLGSPFLDIQIPNAWTNGIYINPATILGHEGRHRMKAIFELFGNIRIETHLFFKAQHKEIRARDVTPNFMAALNSQIISESGKIIEGPWFRLRPEQI